MYTPCMLCGFLPLNIFVLIYQKKKKKKTNLAQKLKLFNEIDGLSLY